MQAIFRRIERVAGIDVPVLSTGAAGGAASPTDAFWQRIGERRWDFVE